MIDIELVIFLLYSFFSFWVGWKVIDGKVNKLEYGSPLSNALKAIVALMIGFFLSIIYLIFFFVRIINRKR